jgi:hypothetical protein
LVINRLDKISILVVNLHRFLQATSSSKAGTALGQSFDGPLIGQTSTSPAADSGELKE